MATIKVTPNQSMLDVIVQAMGSIEGGMVFCSLNEIAISDTPVAGMVYYVHDGNETTLVAFTDSMIDQGVLQYLAQNAFVIGNLGKSGESITTEDGAEDFESESGGENFVTE